MAREWIDVAGKLGAVLTWLSALGIVPSLFCGISPTLCHRNMSVKVSCSLRKQVVYKQAGSRNTLHPKYLYIQMTGHLIDNSLLAENWLFPLLLPW